MNPRWLTISAARTALIAMWFALPALAQQAPQMPLQPPPPATMRSADGSARQSSNCSGQLGNRQPNSDDEANGTSNDRLFWTLPNFLTVQNAECVPPLTKKQKFDVTTRSTFDVAEYPWYASLAAISQARNSDPTYGRGAAGYAKRYGLAFADGTIENVMVNAVAASIFHQDPRYYQLGKGSVWHRAGYAISRLLVIQNDAGHRRFNFSEVLGGASAAGIADAYHPAGERTVANTLTTWWTQMSYDALSLTVKEFWPDIRRKFSKDSK
jgi:hypothetical protein